MIHMELLWSKPKCEECKHQSFVFYDKIKIGQVVRRGCAARGANIENNKYFSRMTNCWYFEKK